jgi:hypothetical protein
VVQRRGILCRRPPIPTDHCAPTPALGRLREAVVLVLLYAVRPLHRFRPWNWRVTLAGVAIGLVGLYRDLHDPDGVERRSAA